MCPKQAERAVQNYFAPGNLAALRELALRRTAQRVDAQMVDYMRAHAIAGPWEAGERVLVASSAARRAGADPLCAGGWPTGCARPGPRSMSRPAQRLSEAERDRVAQALRLAERMGGEAVHRSRPANVPKASMPVRPRQQCHPYRHLAVARARAGGTVLRRSLAQRNHPPRRGHQRACRAAPREPKQRPAASVRRGRPAAPLELRGLARQPGLSVAAARRRRCCCARSWRFPMSRWCLLMAVLASAVTYGLWPSLFACLVSALAYNFFFLPPLYTFTIADPENVVTLLVFVLVAVIASNLTARVRAQAIVARQRAATTEDLYRFSRKLAGIGTLDDLLWATAYQVAQMLQGCMWCCCCREGEDLTVRAGYPPEDTLDEADLAAAKWAWQHGQAAGRGADTLPGARGCSCPCARRAAWWRSSGWIRDEPGPLLTPGPAAAAGFAGRPDGAGDRAAEPGARKWTAARLAGGDRKAALGAADLHQPRSAHAAGLDPGLGHQPEGLSRQRWTTPSRTNCSAPSRRKPSASTISSPICWT